MTEFQSENSVIWHSLELAEGGMCAIFYLFYVMHKTT